MSAEVDEHGRELDAVCRSCDNAITDNEAADHDGQCYVCHEDAEREAEHWAVLREFQDRVNAAQWADFAHRDDRGRR